MDRHGTPIWWLVCIGLVLCWVWNFQTAVESSSKDMAALEMIPAQDTAQPETHAPFRMPQTDKSIERADKIVKRMAETQTTVSTHGISDLRQASTFGAEPTDLDPKINDLPSIDLGEQPMSNMLANVNQNVRETVEPTDNFNAEMASMDSRGSDGWQRYDNVSQDKQRISNPYFNEATDQTTESVQAADPVLTFEGSPTPASDFTPALELSSLPQMAAKDNTTSTDFGSFEDLKQERSEWQQQNTIKVSPADQFVTNGGDSTAPIIPRGQKLTSNATTIQQCVNHIEYGKSLARRGAAFAAREEFYSALRLIAQSNDAQTRSTAYTSALSEAITALNEADDFHTEISHEGMDVNVAHVVDAHTSKIIPMDRAEGMSSMIAIQAYFEFARQRMGDSFDENIVASEALYSLGKLFTVAAAHDLTGNPLDYSKSIVMHYAAIDCDSGNFKSSNELGVLMARNGRLEKARDLFRDSLLVERLPQTWRNLAVVHERIADSSSDSQFASENRELAQKAGREYEIARQSNQSMTPKVQWVTPEQFEQTAPPEFNEPRTAQAQPEPTQTQPAKPGMFSRWKDMF